MPEANQPVATTSFKRERLWDPAARFSSALEALEGVEIPDQMELRRAREILNELRRRRSETKRPTIELDYIDRLLQQF